MITIDEVAELARRELRRKLPPNVKLDDNTEIQALGLSSLQLSEIVFTLEERHNVEFDASRAADVKTLGDVVALANATIAEQHGTELDAGAV